MVKQKRQVRATVNWDMVNAVFEKVPREKLAQSIAAGLFQTKTVINKTTLEKYTDSSSRENYIRSSIIELMSTPEYQLC